MRAGIYKFTFRINASHGSIRGGNVHSHTFEITVYLRVLSEQFSAYEETEKLVTDYLSQYTNVVLNDVAPFDQIPSTLENMGDEFFLRIAEKLEGSGFALTKLEINENPQRVYAVTEDEPDEILRMRLSEAMRTYKSKSTPSQEASDIVPEPVAASVEPAADPIAVDQLTKLPLGKKSSPIFFILSILLVLVAGFAMMTYVRLTQMYPLGLDIHGHLFKSDLLYHEILEGNIYPLFTEFWYNGTQPFRYWAPLPYYTLAGLQFLLGGDVFSSYLAFIFLSFSVGGIGWLIFGRKANRPGLGLFLAFIWFMLPDNLRVFFGEGNFLRMFVTMLIPYVLYCVWQFVEYRRKKMIIPLILIMIVSVFSHLMISAMIGVATAIYLLIYALANKRFLESIQALFAMFFAFAVAGIWLYPSLVGGLTSMGSDATSAVMASWSAPLSVSLNPVYRIFGPITELYFGISIVAIAIVGLFLSNRKSFSGFMTFIIIMLGTTTALTPLVQVLPLSEYFWVRRFTPIVYAMFLIAVLEWRKLKKPLMVAFCTLIAFDSVLSFNLFAYDKAMGQPATVQDIPATMEEYLYSAAKDTTKQRVSLMDLSAWGPLPSYAFSGLDRRIDYVFGWAWQGATTANNIAYLNEAFERHNYLYVFDRNLELGADTVIIDKNQIHNDVYRKSLDDAAARIGYTLQKETDDALLYSYPAEGNFGLVTKYSGLAIGTTAELVPGILPSFHPGDKLMIDDYTVEELMVNERLYLSGFFYNDKETAENIVREVARSGVEVYIDMSRIPTDPLTNRMTFLDVSAQPITFEGSYPDLITDKITADPSPFAEGYESWNTVYLTELKNSQGYTWFENTKLDFVGTDDTENITFIGLNLLFHAYTAGDNEVKTLFDSIMSLDEEGLPNRLIVPLEVTYENNKITIVSSKDNVNTTIAYQDIFRSEQSIREVNHLLVVDSGTTVITMEYPYLSRGIAVSVFGILIEVAICYIVLRDPLGRRRRTKNNSIENS